jgi:hypothetical protein
MTEENVPGSEYVNVSNNNNNNYNNNNSYMALISVLG